MISAGLDWVCKVALRLGWVRKGGTNRTFVFCALGGAVWFDFQFALQEINFVQKQYDWLVGQRDFELILNC